MRQFCLSALCCAILFPATIWSQEFDPETAFGNLKSIRGVWFMPTDRGDRLEIWQVDNDSTMTGRSVRIKPEDGDTVTLETLKLTLRDTNIIYSAVVRGQNANKPVDFKLTEAYSDEFVFTNPKHDDPQIIRYILLGNRELQVTTEGKKNNRVVTREYVFEREFNPVSAEFRLRLGANVSSLIAERKFNNIEESPNFGALPGWDFGLGMVFKGRGGFLSLNTEIGLSGKYSNVRSRFYADTVPGKPIAEFIRDGVYRTTWFNAAVFPEFTFKRDGRLSMIVGPYYGRLISNKLAGTTTPPSRNKLFNSNTDLKKNDFGLVGGLQYRLNLGKKDLDGKFGLRFNLGLSDLDGLYKRRCDNPALCNERILLRGITTYYSVNLVKL